jgi:hypothetical protein
VQVIDQSARRWSLDPGTGAPSFLHTVQMEVWNHDRNQELVAAFPAPKPFRGLAWYGGVTGQQLRLAVRPDSIFVEDAGSEPGGVPGTGTADVRMLVQSRFHCAVVGFPTGAVRVSPSYEQFSTVSGVLHIAYRTFLQPQIFAHGYLPFAHGGDVLLGGTSDPVRAYYWGGNPPARTKFVSPLGPVDLKGDDGVDVQRGLFYDDSTTDLTVWGTSTTEAAPSAEQIQRTRSSASSPN